MQRLSSILATIAFGVGFNTMPAHADDVDDPPDPLNQGRLSFSLGADITSKYFFRGYVQEDQGLIFQPWAELGVMIVEGVDNSPGVSLVFGNWNSLQSEKTGATEANLRSWYESDLYGGITLNWDAFSLGASYTIYMYPNGNTATVHEVGVSAGVTLPEDTIFQKVLGDISLGLYFEVDNSNVNTDEAIYMELGFGPSFDIFDEQATLSIPVALGFSIDDYYIDPSGSDDFFGYFSLGADVAIPLGSSRYGEWTLNVGVNLLFLGSAAEAANGGDDVEVYVYTGVSMSY